MGKINLCIMLKLCLMMGLVSSPTVMASLTVPSTSTGTYTVSWTEPSGGQVNVYLYERSNNEPWQMFRMTGFNQRSFNKPPGTYRYKLQTCIYEPELDGDICNPDSNEVNVIVSAAPAANQIDMLAGRINKLPVSWFFKDTITSSSGLRIKTICNGDGDTGLLFAFGNHTRFNDDSPNAGGNGKGSEVSSAIFGWIPIFEPVQYHIYVFSMRRSTSYCQLFKSFDNGNTWRLHAREQFGGKLVKVGPLHRNDYLEVQTSDNGNAHGSLTDTELLLFDVNNGTNSLIYNDNKSTTDNDPRITINDDNWLGSNNFILIGKTSRPPVTIPLDKHQNAWNNKRVEIQVDFIRGPLNTNQQTASFPVAGGVGDPIDLQPGRYYAWLYAKTNRPVGEGNFNSAKSMLDYCPDYYRGTANELAFTLWAERAITVQTGFSLRLMDFDSWSIASKLRPITRANLGSGPGEGWNLFLLELKVDKPGRYHLDTSDIAENIIFHNKWKVRRNPDASEIRVVTFNALYDGNKHEEKTRNASNLFATQGMIRPDNYEVEELPDQARWQFSADIIGLQELRKARTPGMPSSPWPLRYSELFYYADIFTEEAEYQGSRSWQYVKGRDEDFLAGRSGLGPLFFAENVWPNTRESSIYFSSTSRKHAGCTHRTLDYAECQLEGGGIFTATNFTIPGKATARRYGLGADRPIAVFNIHLEHKKEDSNHRLNEIESLISTIDRLLEKEPNAFNNNRRNRNRKHPKFYQNRIIILGDSNFMIHSCGEHYWILKRLRNHFGYALDVSMVVQRDDNYFAMHDRLDEGSIDFFSDSFQSFENWRNFPDFSPASKYPWWAATFRGKHDNNGSSRSAKANKSERHDVIFLVGKGWAYDDPVLDYKVISDRTDPSPMYPKGGGVEMWIGINSVGNDSARSYAPNHSLGYGTDPGSPALHSDHQPVLTKLRVFMR